MSRKLALSGIAVLLAVAAGAASAQLTANSVSGEWAMSSVNDCPWTYNTAVQRYDEWPQPWYMYYQLGDALYAAVSTDVKEPAGPYISKTQLSLDWTDHSFAQDECEGNQTNHYGLGGHIYDSLPNEEVLLTFNHGCSDDANQYRFFWITAQGLTRTSGNTANMFLNIEDLEENVIIYEPVPFEASDDVSRQDGGVFGFFFRMVFNPFTPQSDGPYTGYGYHNLGTEETTILTWDGTGDRWRDSNWTWTTVDAANNCESTDTCWKPDEGVKLAYINGLGGLVSHAEKRSNTAYPTQPRGNVYIMTDNRFTGGGPCETVVAPGVTGDDKMKLTEIRFNTSTYEIRQDLKQEEHYLYTDIQYLGNCTSRRQCAQYPSRSKIGSVVAQEESQQVHLFWSENTEHLPVACRDPDDEPLTCARSEYAYFKRIVHGKAATANPDSNPPARVPNFTGTINEENIAGLIVRQTDPTILFAWDHPDSQAGVVGYQIVLQELGIGWRYSPFVHHPVKSYTMETSDLKDGASYRALIRAKDRDGQWGLWAVGGTFTVVLSETGTALDFTDFEIEGYGGTHQAGNPEVTREDGGATLHLVGNGWRKISFPYTVTADTVLHFDFKSGSQGEVHGVGFDTDDGLSDIQFFKVYGTQGWGIRNYDDYAGSAPDWKHYVIPVGLHLTGPQLYLTFGNDHDAAPSDGESYYSNVRVFEDDQGVLDFTGRTIEGYGGTRQAGNPEVTREDGGATLHLVGNGWRKISFPYTVTADTVLHFDFKSGSQGEVHGVGFDTDDGLSDVRFFKVYGTQGWGIRDYDDYAGSAPDWKHYVIPVGLHVTGTQLYLTFGNDHDAAPSDGESYYSNIRVHE